MSEKPISKDYLPQALSDIENRLKGAFKDYNLSSIKIDQLYKGSDKFQVKAGFLSRSLAPDAYYMAQVDLDSPLIKRVVVVIPLAIGLVGLKRDKRAVMAGFISWWGAFVNASIPTTILVKRIHELFILTKRVFIPYYKADRCIDANKIYKEKKNWNLLLDKLNTDEELSKNLDSLDTEFKAEVYGPWYMDSGKRWKAEINDLYCEPWKTMLIAIPVGYKTMLVAFYPVHAKNVERIVKAMFMVAKHIVEFNYGKESYGIVPKELEGEIKVLYALLSKEEGSPQQTQT